MKPLKGFTLIELLISITIFSIISIAAFKLFDAVSKASSSAQGLFTNLNQLQRSHVILENDLSQIVARSVRDQYGDKQPALAIPSSELLLIEFTRTGWLNPLDQSRSSLQRVAYSVKDGNLVRTFWAHPDQSHSTVKKTQKLLRNVSDLKVRVLSHQQQWLNQWPADKKNLTHLPSAIELTVNQLEYGEIKYLVPVVSFLPKEKNTGKDT